MLSFGMSDLKPKLLKVRENAEKTIKLILEKEVFGDE